MNTFIFIPYLNISGIFYMNIKRFLLEISTIKKLKICKKKLTKKEKLKNVIVGDIRKLLTNLVCDRILGKTNLVRSCVFIVVSFGEFS